MSRVQKMDDNISETRFMILKCVYLLLLNTGAVKIYCNGADVDHKMMEKMKCNEMYFNHQECSQSHIEALLYER